MTAGVSGADFRQMLVFFKEKLVIFATTKTGSTALQGALMAHASMTMRSPPGLKHMNVRRYQRILEPSLRELGAPKKLETFALIRHPLDWLSSWYRYRSRNELLGQPQSTRDVTFNDFVLEYLADDPAPFANVGKQSNFLIGHDGQVGIDHLYQYEMYPSALRFLSHKLGLDIETNQRNVSPAFSVNLDADIKARLQDECRLEFDLWEIAQR